MHTLPKGVSVLGPLYKISPAVLWDVLALCDSKLWEAKLDNKVVKAHPDSMAAEATSWSVAFLAFFFASILPAN